MSLFPSNVSNTGLSPLTLDCLTDIRKTGLRERERNKPDAYLHELTRRVNALRDAVIQLKAIRFFVLYDEEALQADAPYFDDLMDGRVGELQLALYDMDMDKEANMIEQILWKLVNATITEQYRST